MQFYCVIGEVELRGHFGPSYVDEKGKFHKGIVLLDVIADCETAIHNGSKEIHFYIESPGGYVDVGDAVYNYMEGLKGRGIKVVTIQDGIVGSIATKPFLAGERRVSDPRYEMWIHNPFIENFTGDADDAKKVAEDLTKTEEDLRNFYASFSSIPKEALDTLMKQTTGMTANQCLTFGFATEVKEIPVLNLINNKKMSDKKDDKSLKEQILALLGVKQEPKAQIPGQAKKQNMVVTLAEGQGAFWVEGESLVEGAKVFLLDESGEPTAQPLPDGEYGPTDSGAMLTVAGGVVTAVTMPSSEQEASTFTQEQVNEIVAKAVADAKNELSAEINKVKEDSKNEILALKKNMQIGKLPKQAVIGLPKGEISHKSIAEKQAEAQEKRKNKFNNN